MLSVPSWLLPVPPDSPTAGGSGPPTSDQSIIWSESATCSELKPERKRGLSSDQSHPLIRGLQPLQVWSDNDLIKVDHLLKAQISSWEHLIKVCSQLWKNNDNTGVRPPQSLIWVTQVQKSNSSQDHFKTQSLLSKTCPRPPNLWKKFSGPG